MPLNRFVSRRKPLAMKPKRTYRKKATYSSFANKVKQVINRVAETKSVVYPITEYSMTTLTSPAIAWTLNTVASGSGLNQRSGQKISPKYIDVRGHVHTGDGGIAQYVKVMLLSCNISDDGLTELQENNTGTIAPAGTDVSAIYNRINTTKYRVLGTRLMKIGPTGGNWFGTAFFSMKAKLSGVSHFDQGSNIPEKNKLILVAIARRADNDESTGTTTEITFNSKFYFQDV